LLSTWPLLHLALTKNNPSPINHSLTLIKTLELSRVQGHNGGAV